MFAVAVMVFMPLTLHQISLYSDNPVNLKKLDKHKDNPVLYSRFIEHLESNKVITNHAFNHIINNYENEKKELEEKKEKQRLIKEQKAYLTNQTTD